MEEVRLSPFFPLQFLLREACGHLDRAEETLQVLGLNDLSKDVWKLRERIGRVDFMTVNGDLRATVPEQ